MSTHETYGIGEVNADSKTLKTIKVFKESPEWDNNRRWFMIPMHILRDLHVATFHVEEEVWDDHKRTILPKVEAIYDPTQHVYVY